MSDNCKSTKKLCNRFRDVIHSIQIVLIIFFILFFFKSNKNNLNECWIEKDIKYGQLINKPLIPNQM